MTATQFSAVMTLTPVKITALRAQILADLANDLLEYRDCNVEAGLRLLADELGILADSIQTLESCPSGAFGRN
jgi:hypothetical protein